MSEVQFLQHAKEAIARGDKTTGQKLLLRILKGNPHNETAWLWLSALTDDPSKERECLERVLEINPDNQVAQQHLRKLQSSMPSSIPQIKELPAQPPVPQQIPDSSQSADSHSPELKKNNAKLSELVKHGLKTVTIPPQRIVVLVGYGLSLLPLIIGLVWLADKVNKLEKTVENLQDEVDYIGDLARNANMYAHTHSWSDERLKTNIQDISDPLDGILALHGIRFEWTEAEYADPMSLNSKTQIGFLAQEVEQVYPELVTTAPSGYKMIDYAKLTPVLVEAIKEQQAMIDQLRNQAQLRYVCSSCECSIAQEQ